MQDRDYMSVPNERVVDVVATLSTLKQSDDCDKGTEVYEHSTIPNVKC